MALQKNTNYLGLVSQDTYIRIDSLDITSKKTMNVHVNFYASSDERFPFKSEVFPVSYDINGENAFAQAYAAVKAMPQFSGAADV